MRELQLHRLAEIPEGVFGVLKDSGVPFCVTVENNDYIYPDGDYIIRRIQSPKYGETFEVTNVPGRTHILLHWGNWEDNSLGCTILGEAFDPLMKKDGKMKNGVAYSKKAFAEFMRRMEGVDEALLRVRTRTVI